MNDGNIAAPGSPKYADILEEIRQIMIELTSKADAIGWDWSLDARPLNNKQRRVIVLTEKKVQP